MLSFTDTATGRLNKVLEASEAVRVAVMGGECAGMTYALTIDSEADEDDILIELDHVKVYIDPHSASILEKSTIDFVSMGLNEGFVFNNPEANTTCGCDSSFS
jgi:iron-sulfur cluster assembly protein